MRVRTEASTHSALKGAGKSSAIVNGARTNSPAGRQTNGKQLIFFFQSVTSSFIPCLTHLSLSPTDVTGSINPSNQRQTRCHSGAELKTGATAKLFNVRASWPSFFTQLLGSTTKAHFRDDNHGNSLNKVFMKQGPTVQQKYSMLTKSSKSASLAPGEEILVSSVKMYSGSRWV